MSFTIRDGWIEGDLYGVPVRRFPQGPYAPLAEVKPNLVLHTTETAGYVESLRYPSQFQVGEGFIGQHKPLWAKGEALRGDTTNDPYAMQIEIVGFSRLDVWLPPLSSLKPLVALMAFLHEARIVRTALDRPADWPVLLDRGPQASESYYRRLAGLWPTTSGVYGHVEIPGNDHWDPGSLDYPRLFEEVSDVMGYDEFKEGWKAHRLGEPLGPNWSADKTFGWNARKDAIKPYEHVHPLYSRLDHTHEGSGVEPHTHAVTGTAS